MEAAPGTAQSDTSCRNPSESPEMPGEGPGLRGTEQGWGGAVWENALIPTIYKNGEKMNPSLSESGKEEKFHKEKLEYP